MDSLTPWLHDTALPFADLALGPRSGFFRARHGNRVLHTIGPRRASIDVAAFFPNGVPYARFRCGHPAEPSILASSIVSAYSAHTQMQILQRQWGFFGSIDAPIYALLAPLFPLPKLSVEIRFTRNGSAIDPSIIIDRANALQHDLIFPFDDARHWPAMRADIAALFADSKA